MSRLPSLRREQLDPAGQAVWDAAVGTAAGHPLAESGGPEVVGKDGGLIGPFNAWVTAPEIGRRLADLGAHLIFSTSIDKRLLELAIVTVGAHWKAEFEWWAHRLMAARHGIADTILDALEQGRPPAFDHEDERLVHAVASQLVASGHIDKSTYDGAQGLLGDVGMVELVSLCGYYTTVSFMLDAFEVPLPAGVTQVWADQP